MEPPNKTLPLTALPGTEVPPALLGGLLPRHAAGGPLRVGTGRGGRRRLHRAEAAAGSVTVVSAG